MWSWWQPGSTACVLPEAAPFPVGSGSAPAVTSGGFCWASGSVPVLAVQHLCPACDLSRDRSQGPWGRGLSRPYPLSRSQLDGDGLESRCGSGSGSGPPDPWGADQAVRAVSRDAGLAG